MNSKLIVPKIFLIDSQTGVLFLGQTLNSRDRSLLPVEDCKGAMFSKRFISALIVSQIFSFSSSILDQLYDKLPCLFLTNISR